MPHLIDKSALVAEIERMLKKEYPCDNPEQETGYSCALYELQDFIDTLEVKEIGVDLGDPKGDKSAKYIIDTKTLEVKEVELEKYYHDFLQKEWFDKNCSRTVSEMMAFTAKHFFELGLQVAQKGE